MSTTLDAIRARDIKIMAEAREGASVGALADRYGLSPSTIMHITSGKTGRTYDRARKLTWVQVLDVRRMHAEGVSLTAIGATFGISAPMACMIASGKCYAKPHKGEA